MIISTPVVTRVRKQKTDKKKEFGFIPAYQPDDTSDSWAGKFREQARERYAEQKFPTIRDEAWRRTSISRLDFDSFRLVESGAKQGDVDVPENLLEPIADGAHGGEIVLLPGEARVQLSAALQEKGIIFTDLKTAEKEHPALLKKMMGKVVSPEDGKFAALAEGYAQTGIVLYVPKGVQIEEPLHSLFWGPGSKLAYVSHLIIYLEEGASVTYVHEAASPEETNGQTLHAGAVEITVGKAASLRFVELQSWGRHVWNFSHERVKVERDGRIDWIFGSLGSHLTKNFLDLDLAGQGSEGRMSGFYFTDDSQHLDHDTQQNHLAPNTTSDLLFKGALMGKSRSVWQGMIYVAPGADKTDGYQSNRNLILNSDSRADSIPGLEIKADDVRCTHGATVGKIDPEQVFYLLSRGIPQEEAEKLIVEGFFDPIMQRIPFEGVRSRFQDAIHTKMMGLTL
ncbi:MAG: Fe-S cluster assembly protein SufD [Anaerolineaceae bacterium]|jgi:Fe-S cluster assembly protein SufD|nr:Fe-S cluster assembly protein SufD [Anaerolineaceae bacterium]